MAVSLGPSRRSSAKNIVAVWLFACAAFVMAMVVVGGITRLTRSGLSIVEWKPILGALPPLSESDWRDAFSAYQQSPEGRLVNANMDLDAFKQIFLVEWLHRLLGRVVGVVVFVPFVYFAVTRRLSSRRAIRVLMIFLLGGLQGFLGWFMVQSGLENEPHVSPYRLTLHLGMALAIFSLLVWNALDEMAPSRSIFQSPPPLLRPLAIATLVTVALTVAWGGMMAGHHAGLLAPTFPDINGAFIPSGMFSDATAPFSDALTVHFLHRVLAGCTALGALVTFAVAHVQNAPRSTRLASSLLVLAVALQVALGALTVLHHVPIALAALHQLNGALLLGCAVALAFTARR
jgi:cytochrome c oxidase assembly protein subunit 15